MKVFAKSNLDLKIFLSPTFEIFHFLHPIFHLVVFHKFFPITQTYRDVIWSLNGIFSKGKWTFTNFTSKYFDALKFLVAPYKMIFISNGILLLAVGRQTVWAPCSDFYFNILLKQGDCHHYNTKAAKRIFQILLLTSKISPLDTLDYNSRLLQFCNSH